MASEPISSLQKLWKSRRNRRNPSARALIPASARTVRRSLRADNQTRLRMARERLTPSASTSTASECDPKMGVRPVALAARASAAVSAGGTIGISR